MEAKRIPPVAIIIAAVVIVTTSFVTFFLGRAVTPEQQPATGQPGANSQIQTAIPADCPAPTTVGYNFLPENVLVKTDTGWNWWDGEETYETENAILLITDDFLLVLPGKLANGVTFAYDNPKVMPGQTSIVTLFSDGDQGFDGAIFVYGCPAGNGYLVNLTAFDVKLRLRQPQDSLADQQG